MTTTTLDPETFTAAPAPEIPKEKEDPKDLLKRGRKPPKDGPCKGCGKDKPLNRLFLCYECWVKAELRDKFGWEEGKPHPSGCGCGLPEAHP